MARRNTFEVDEDLESPFNARHLKRAMVYIRRHTKKMGLTLLLSAAASVSGLLGPTLLRWTVEDAIPGENLPLLALLAGCYLAATLLGILFTSIRARIMARVSQQIIFDIREDLFAHLQRLPFSYYDSRPAGKILVRIINYVNSVSDMLSNGIVNLILEIVNILFIIGFMLFTSPVLTLFVVGGLPFFVAVVWFIKPRQRKAWQEQSNKASNMNAFLAENIDGVRVSQLFARQQTNITVMERLSQAVRRCWLRAVFLANWVWVSSELLTQIVLSLLYIAGVYWLSGSSQAELGVLLAMALYLKSFWQPITNLANIYNGFVNNIAYLERIFETMDEPVEVADCENAAELPQIKGGVFFQNVTFAYEPGINILENLNLSVSAGQSVALVGPTGAGKTTVVNLISRFYNLTGGAILLDGGHDISRVTLRSLRAQMGIMLQDSFIFSGTVMDNIKYGRLDATDAEAEAAARAVQAHGFISEMEKGYFTEVNERGSRLSQGQRQLVSFARTLLADPRILILDEATSSIDTKTERLLQEGIAALIAGRTSFIIAHRLSTIKHCDRILYIGDKQVLEDGSHDQLIAKKGLYYQLYMAQVWGAPVI
ncbi:MAG: ABC transporter ATP-binding protein/permease [Oscillospiraceae bacterium]|nr:ABC transporter ATP-binding protein/permease [Oscillospiraceae bacterium]